MKILLVEPDYKNKYPPMGLMKLSSYHKQRGDRVIFFKGVMKQDDFIDHGFDRVYISTLFTFHFSKTVSTIKSYTKLINPSAIYIGGIMSTLMYEKLKNDIHIDISIHKGLLSNSKVLKLGDSVNIDSMPLDYSILDHIEYVYPSRDNYFSYCSRGCSNKCGFCAVPILEPKLKITNSISEHVLHTNNKYGEKKNLLLLDNNILSFSESRLVRIVNNIHKLGFGKDSKYFAELPFNDYLRRLSNVKDYKYAFDIVMTKLVKYLNEQKDKKKSQIYYNKYNELIEDMNISDQKYEFIIKNKNIFEEILSKYHKPSGSKRCVDFNQGMDARQLTESKMLILSKINIEPFRLAFDNASVVGTYSRAVRLASKYGVKQFSNYMLYNFLDSPEELWDRLKVNIDLAKELNVKIFSFPMRYAPVDYTTRDYIGKHWNKHYLSSIYAILNVTKGIVADGESFFKEAFGGDIQEYFEILSMPRPFIIFRSKFKDLGITQEWQKKYRLMNDNEKSELFKVLEGSYEPNSYKVIDILQYYNIKEDILCQQLTNT